MKLTKLLPLNAKPAKALLARAKKIHLTYAERVNVPTLLTCEGVSLEKAFDANRPLEVGDVLVDEKGAFYVVEASDDRLMRVTGNNDMLHEAAFALMNRGVRLAKTDNGFAMIENEQFRTMLKTVGLHTESFVAPFVPIALPEEPEEETCCCCGHHHHHHDGDCDCCGEHHHDDEECCCGHHHHDEECGCGHHHHDDGECCCGHHHHHDEDCECGHHHDHDDKEACCCHHHHDDDCGCGHKHE